MLIILSKKNQPTQQKEIIKENRTESSDKENSRIIDLPQIEIFHICYLNPS